METKLKELILAAIARYEAMTPQEQAAMWEGQRQSWVRAEAAFGSDADEARERAALRAKSPKPNQA